MADDRSDHSTDEATDEDAGTDEAEVTEAGATDGEGTTEATGSKGKAVAGEGAPVVRKKVVSRRVTPKGGPQGAKGGATRGSTAARAHAAEGDDAGYSSRYTPPTAKYAQGPSPWWVPAIMFGLLVVGSLIIIFNYAGVFGDADNLRLVLGLGFILGGIITATQLR